MLEEDYRLICEENGISSSINLTRAKELDMIDKGKNSSRKYEEDII
jgi:hypothetical protein